MERFTKAWFVARLTDFLHERHPQLEHDDKLLERRGDAAAMLYAQGCNTG